MSVVTQRSCHRLVTKSRRDSGVEKMCSGLDEGGLGRRERDTGCSAEGELASSASSSAEELPSGASVFSWEGVR